MNKLVLFDFDGTLADSAPDLAATANRMRQARGLPDLPYEDLRPYASHGARGLIKVALDIHTDHPEYAQLRAHFLQDYHDHMTELTYLFDGVAPLLKQLEQAGYTWGIVTNKLEYLALPLIRHLGLEAGCAVTVGGDTTQHTKPHPEPLLYAAKQAGFAPEDCLYVGDDLRDIQAGQAAGMATMIAAYGYCADDDSIGTWQADLTVHHAGDIWEGVQRWANDQLSRPSPLVC
ncbi:phosphoglycolate phosphatase, bacterial [Alcaligenes pakistanensis]|uniref:phosphoglycolate phosphatase n=1 Tax=Alcaligenes pakistanensis TaxID=1482717 RepID=A0A8H9M3D0_9BURK|nr:phosphoglycolate phosphatase [Alcaligenes pakistanensis]MBP6623090.1 phosphoglycolate phosphatase [Alcaligenes sp.]GHC38504.1 phosphoglycolate phosphatase, bacterial [Alcaligenes pakistanensis]